MVRKTKSGEAKADGKPFLRRFGRDRRGSVSIEFALLALPFSILVFAMLESCVSFAAQELLANATQDVARMLRTGQVKAATVTEASLKQMICSRMTILVPSGCPDLEVDLRQFSTFADAAAVRVKITNNDIDKTGFAVTPGKSMTINMLRTFYRWPVITNILASSVSTLKGNKTLHFATVTWQNEPFDD